MKKKWGKPLIIVIPLGICLVAVSYLFLGYSGWGEKEQQVTLADSIPTVDSSAIEMVYGIPVADFSIVEYVVKNGDNVSSIMNKNGISMELVHKIVTESSSLFDLTKIVAGKKFHFFFSKSGQKNPEFMVYVPDKLKYIKADLRKGIQVEMVKKEVVSQTSSIGGEIRSSLYQAVEDQGKDITLAYKIAEIFKWSIDFFALQKGDKFKVIFKENLVDAISHGTGDILAAYFYHGGKEYYAIGFEQGDKKGYYDLQGMSMKARFLQAPLEFTRISSGYSQSRYHPILKKRTPHLGIDYAAPMGTPIVSIADGTVIECAYKGGNGNYVKIKHDDVYSTQYLHMSKFGEGIKKGVRVSQGQVIGYVGSTGLSTGPHLCFRFWKDGKQVDASKETPQATEPLQEIYKEAFFKVKDEIMPLMAQTGYFDHSRKSALQSLKRVTEI